MNRLLKSLTCMLALCALTVSATAQNPPMAHGKGSAMTTAEALKLAPKTDPALAPLDKTYQAAAAGLKKSPQSAKAKKAYVDAAYAYAQACMADRGKLPPPVQYRSALALYRNILAVDPHHAGSLSQSKTIEAVYKQMGMPIPK